MDVFISVILAYIAWGAWWSFYNWCRYWYAFDWTIFGFGFLIYLNADYQWSMDLGFSVPRWVYRLFNMKGCVIPIRRLWNVPLNHIPFEFRDPVLRRRHEDCVVITQLKG